MCAATLAPLTQSSATIKDMEANLELFLFVLRILIVGLLYGFLYWALVTMWRSIAQKSTAAESVGTPNTLHLKDQNGNLRQFADPKLTIGRHPSCELKLEDDAISLRHARIFWEDGLWWLNDLDSRNGTFLNALPIEEAHILSLNDQIDIGHSSFTVILD